VIRRQPSGENAVSIVREFLLGFRKGDLVMQQFKNAVVNFMKREDGPTAVEYAVMLALIIVVCITAITALGTNANKTFTTVSNIIGGTAS
jgi:pilus assembly protein Flp/PilA